MYINIDGFTEILDAEISVYLGHSLIHHRKMAAPKQFLKVEFFDLVNRVAQDQRPFKVKIERQEIIWDQFTQSHKAIPNSIEFSNNAYLKMEEEESA